MQPRPEFLGQMRRESDMAGQEPVVLMEMTLRNLSTLGKPIEHADFLARVDTLGALGKMVMISNYSRFHNVTTYLRRYTHKRIGMALGVPTLVELLEAKYYTDLDGGVLEALGRLFRGPVKLYVYPWQNHRTGELVTLDSFQVPAHVQHLFAHLRANHFIEPISEYKVAGMSILPGEVLTRLQAGDPIWETMVPPVVVRLIKQRNYFAATSG